MPFDCCSDVCVTPMNATLERKELSHIESKPSLKL